MNIVKILSISIIIFINYNKSLQYVSNQNSQKLDNANKVNASMNSLTDAQLVGNNKNKIVTKDDTKIRDNDLLFAIGGALVATVLVAMAIIGVIFIIFKRERKARKLAESKMLPVTNVATKSDRRTATHK
uniref:Plasmodium variant antigen protein Cir/Yir/Bir n=1 Tax=Strongyloides stercoralis TaxID=6248 RepID=A0A0K0EFE6_STRER